MTRGHTGLLSDIYALSGIVIGYSKREALAVVVTSVLPALENAGTRELNAAEAPRVLFLLSLFFPTKQMKKRASPSESTHIEMTA